jgi:hypothetical protein
LGRVFLINVTITKKPMRTSGSASRIFKLVIYSLEMEEPYLCPTSPQSDHGQITVWIKSPWGRYVPAGLEQLLFSDNCLRSDNMKACTE